MAKNLSIQPLGDRVVVKPASAEEVSAVVETVAA
jgi:co-chaperonin GroES (HSP10)